MSKVVMCISYHPASFHNYVTYKQVVEQADMHSFVTFKRSTPQHPCHQPLTLNATFYGSCLPAAAQGLTETAGMPAPETAAAFAVCYCAQTVKMHPASLLCSSNKQDEQSQYSKGVRPEQ